MELGYAQDNLWLDDFQLERSSTASEWIGPVAFESSNEWILSASDGTKQAHAHFMNNYGVFLRDFALDLALDTSEDGHFDLLAVAAATRSMMLL